MISKILVMTIEDGEVMGDMAKTLHLSMAWMRC